MGQVGVANASHRYEWRYRQELESRCVYYGANVTIYLWIRRISNKSEGFTPPRPFVSGSILIYQRLYAFPCLRPTPTPTSQTPVYPDTHCCSRQSSLAVIVSCVSSAPPSQVGKSLKGQATAEQTLPI